MLLHSEPHLTELASAEEFVRAVAELVLARPGQFTTTYELTNEVCDRYFASAGMNRTTSVASWPTSQAQPSIRLEESHETRTSRPMHSNCA